LKQRKEAKENSRLWKGFCKDYGSLRGENELVAALLRQHFRCSLRSPCFATKPFQGH
jgi:hypothetical protein